MIDVRHIPKRHWIKIRLHLSNDIVSLKNCRTCCNPLSCPSISPKILKNCAPQEEVTRPQRPRIEKCDQLYKASTMGSACCINPSLSLSMSSLGLLSHWINGCGADPSCCSITPSGRCKAA